MFKKEYGPNGPQGPWTMGPMGPRGHGPKIKTNCSICVVRKLKNCVVATWEEKVEQVVDYCLLDAQ